MNNDRPGIDEQYAGANNTSNLTIDPERKMPGDVIIAAGWSPTRTGASILRLHSEWDGAEHPARPSETDLKLLAGKLKTFKEVRDQIINQAALWGIEDPFPVSVDVLWWWLAPTCTACQGRRWELISNTPHLSGRLCYSCHGTGKKRLPHGPAGKRLAIWIDTCVDMARQSMKQRLRQNYR